MADSEAPVRSELAEHRTEYAEDRTLLAVERTMASWLSASFAAIGVALGFRALFWQMEPWWVPRLVASLFLILAMLMPISAERRSCAALARLSSHSVRPPSNAAMRTSAYGVALGAAVIAAGIWLFTE